MRREFWQRQPRPRRPAELLVSDIGRLRRLVEELMEISRFDAGAETVHAEPVDLGEQPGERAASRRVTTSAGSAASASAPVATRRGLRFSRSSPRANGSAMASSSSTSSCYTT